MPKDRFRDTAPSASATTRRLDVRHMQLSLSLFALLLPNVGMAEIYKWVDEHGKTHFSERKDSSGRAKPLGLTAPTASEKAQTDRSSAQYWQEQETRFRQRQAQKSAEAAGGKPAATKPRSVTGGRSDDTDASRCALARDVLSGSLAHPNGEPIDKYDLETAENDVRSYCNR